GSVAQTVTASKRVSDAVRRGLPLACDGLGRVLDRIPDQFVNDRFSGVGLSRKPTLETRK
ncbi:hypothetical protein, partial [Tateyamaria sp.]